ncbi:hypothetical protein BH20ACT2_BH20ACT2_16370 [soil metagenome]
MNPAAAGSERRTRAVTVLAAAAVLAAICVPLVLDSSPAEAAELERFSSCGELEGFLDQSRAAAGGGTTDGDDMTTTVADAGSADRAAAPAPSTAPSAAGREATGGPESAPLATQEGFTADEASGAGGTGSTNVQVVGVDELDRVDADGERLLTVDDEGRVRLVDVGAASVVDGPDLDGWGHQLSWDVERGVAWVVAQGDDGTNQTAEVTRLRVGDAVEADGTWEVTGWLAGARRIGDRLHVVVNDEPAGRGGEAVPFAGTGAPPVACDQVWRPAEPSSPTALLVATLDADDPGDDLAPVAATEVLGGGDIVYSSTDALYVATPLWSDRGLTETSIHRFSLEELTWTGSGRVPGTPLGQFALDELDGVLRVATTTEAGFRVMPVEPQAPRTAPSDDGIDNLVLTLDTEGALEEIGRVAGLGKPGERIRGIRFDGTIAYVVTFLQTDPLYVVDLADPAAPVVVGELEIPGFSSYLHPVGDDLVVGIGQEGTADGTLTGAQAQLFDVSDRTAPRQLDALRLGDESEAVWDHHAYADLGAGTFAVPASDWSDQPVPLPEPLPEPLPMPGPEPAPPAVGGVPSTTIAPDGDAPVTSPGSIGTEPLPTEPRFAPEPEPPQVGVHVLAAGADGLRRTAELDLSSLDRGVEIYGAPVRTVAVGDRFAVVIVGRGVAVFGANGSPARWISLA